MRTLIPILAATALLAAGTAAAADPAAPAPSAPREMRAERHAAMGERMFERLDANQDGRISRAEYQAWVDQRFARLDPEGKGRLDARDIANSPVARAQAERRAERLVARYDRSGSGSFDKADFEAREMERFERLAAGADSIDQAAFKAGMQHHGKRMRGKGMRKPQP